MELEKLKVIAAGILGLSPAEISETADFSEVYGADSLEVFRIVTAIEEEFEAEFPEETARGSALSGMRQKRWHPCEITLSGRDIRYGQQK